MGRGSILRFGVLPIATLVLGIVLTVIQPRFGTLSNMLNITFQAGVMGILAFGNFFSVLGGGCDFSAGAQIALASVVGAAIMIKYGTFAGVLAAILACMFAGTINGTLITKFRANPLIITLGVQWLINGLALMISKGQVIYGLPNGFQAFGLLNVGGIPIAAIVSLGTFLAAYFVLHLTTFGRQLYAVGANDRAARLAGIPVDSRRIMTYVISSLAAAVAGLVLTASVGTGQPSLGGDALLQSFIAIFIAGVRWGGGEGSIVATAFGVLFVAVLTNGLNVLNVSSYAQMVISGGILVIALAADVIRQQGISLKSLGFGKLG